MTKKNTRRIEKDTSEEEIDRRQNNKEEEVKAGRGEWRKEG